MRSGMPDVAVSDAASDAAVAVKSNVQPVNAG